MNTPNPNKIVLVHPVDSFHPNQGGAIRHIMYALYTFVKQRWDVTVIGTKIDVPDDTTSWKQTALISESPPNMLKRIPYWIRYLIVLYLKAPFMRLPDDAVILTHRMDCMLPFVLFHARNPKVLISAIPGNYLRTQYPFFYTYFGWIYRFFERICLKGIDCIIPVDPTTQSYYDQHQPNMNLTTCLPTAIDLSYFQLTSPEKARALLGWPTQSPIVLFVGRLAMQKNIPFLIRAFAKVEKILPQAQLHIAGDGECGEEIRLLARQLCSQVIFEGVVSPEKVPVYYNAANVSVLPSLEEGSPTVLKESLACGTPVISTDVGDAKLVLSLANDLGKIVGSNEQDLAQAMIEYLNMSETDNLREKRHKVMEAFSVENFGKRLTEICYQAQQAKNNTP